MSAGSSPGTSEIISAGIRAGRAVAASLPPFTRLRCLRTAFTACFSASVPPFDRRDENCRGTARNERQHEVVRPQPGKQRQHPVRGREPGGVGHRMSRLDHLDAVASAAVAVAG